MSERFLTGGRTVEGPAFAVDDFSVPSFGPSAAREEKPSQPVAPRFDEFERPAPSQADGWAPRRDGPEEPSLGYLFNPFDPGEIRERVFDQDFKDLPKPEDYEYAKMDTRDTGIVDTLEMANRKAGEIVAGAFEQGRRLEERMIEVAKADAEDLLGEARDKAEALEAETLGKAKEEAQAIIDGANGQVAQIEALKAEAERLRRETEDVKARTEATLAGVEAREAALGPREAEVERLRGEIERERLGILEQAKREAEAARNKAAGEGLAQGRSQGREQGQAEARAEVLDKAKGFFGVMGRMEDLWRELWRQKAPFMVTLAVEGAEAIVNKEIENGRGLAAGAFSACLEYLRKCHTATFRVRPEDLAEIEEARSALRDKVDGLVNISFRPDPSLGPGDIIMESDAGLLDATLKNRRERVMAVLREALENGLVAELPPEYPQASPEAGHRQANPSSQGGSPADLPQEPATGPAGDLAVNGAPEDSGPGQPQAGGANPMAPPPGEAAGVPEASGPGQPQADGANSMAPPPGEAASVPDASGPGQPQAGGADPMALPPGDAPSVPDASGPGQPQAGEANPMAPPTGDAPGANDVASPAGPGEGPGQTGEGGAPEP
ncbi:MAG: hypothetical protein LBP92_14670 [Deltaproteobacteria bacterium]|nr:hypothetical protein [Deltaproteobacteria bacterium]